MTEELQDIRCRSFARAAEALGGVAILAKHLRVSSELAAEWANGTLPIPDFFFLKVIDLLLDDISARELADFAELHEDPAMVAMRRARLALLAAAGGDDKTEKR
jgi:hypothetical protein